MGLSMCKKSSVSRLKYLTLIACLCALSGSVSGHILVEGIVVLELKAITAVLPIHEAQLLTYLRMTGKPIGLLLNFNVPVMIDGITRKINA
jgi:GxxExxY protein